MKYEIKQLNNTDAVILSDEEIKEGAVKEIYLEYISPPQSYLRIFEFGTLKQLFIQKNINIGNCGWRKKVIATISPFKLEGLPMLELSNKTPIIDTFWLEKLCYYDRRNPDFQIKEEFGYDKEEVEATGNFSKKDCACDNCFYGRTRMAEKYISELPNQEEDVEKLAENYINDDLNLYESLVDGHIYYNIGIDLLNKLFIAGHKSAQKQYSEEDMRKAIEMAREVSGMEAVVKLIQNEHLNTEDFQYTEEEIIQSLEKKKFPTSVELTEDFKVIKWIFK